MMLSEQPGRNQLLAQRFSERSRLRNLTQRLGALDPDRHERAIEALQEAARTSAERLANIDAELGGPTSGEVERSGLRVSVLRPSQAPGEKTVQQAKAEARARMRMVLVALQHLPPGCTDAAATLKKAINVELRRLDRLKADERRQHEHKERVP